MKPVEGPPLTRGFCVCFRLSTLSFQSSQLDSQYTWRKL